MLILEALRGNRPHFKPFRASITQYWCGKPLDAEALASGTGPLIDAFMDADVIDDDSPNGYLEDYQLSLERVPKMADRKIVVIVSGIDTRNKLQI